MGQKYQYLAKKANFGPNLTIFGPKILIFMGVNKSFDTHITENHLATCLHCFLVGMGSNGPKMPILSVFGQIWLFLGQKSIFGGME